MATSNPRPVTVVIPPALDSVGWEVRVLAPDFATVLSINPEYTALTYSLQLNNEGGGSITFDMNSALFDSPSSALLLSQENLFEFYEDGTLRCQWLADVVTEKILESGETRTVTISGPGIGHVLTWATVWPPNSPNVAGQPTVKGEANPLWIWSFPSQPVMKSYLALLHAAQQRRTIPFVFTSFSATRDSAGQVWMDDPSVPTVEYVPAVNPVYMPTIGDDLQTILNTLTGQDAASPSTIFCEWLMRPNFILDVRRQFGTHLESKVVFHEGGSMVSKDRTRTRTDIANYVMVMDSLGNYHFAQDSASETQFKQREGMHVTSALSTTAAQQIAMTSVLLKQKKDEISTWTLTVNPLAPGRRAFVDYNLGDWIGVENNQYVLEPYRVMAIAGSVDVNGQLTQELTLESVLDFAQLALQRQLVAIETTVKNGAVMVGPAGAAGAPGAAGTPGADGSGGTGGAGTFGGQVFIQLDDPGASANTGDFWLRTSS